MGGTVTVDGSPEMEISVAGTAPLARIEVFKQSDKIAERTFNAGDRAVEIRWSGARSRTRHKVQNWSGGLSVDRGRIDEIEEFGFDHPEQGVTHQTNTSVRWDGSTSGNYQGIRVQLASPNDATVSVSTEPVSTEFSLDEIDDGRQIDAGHLDRKLEIREVSPTTRKCRNVTLVDEAATPGTYPYFVRVTQTDGEMAWSSPILVTIE
jgi:hypothetical protein